MLSWNKDMISKDFLTRHRSFLKNWTPYPLQWVGGPGDIERYRLPANIGSCRRDKVASLQCFLIMMMLVHTSFQLPPLQINVSFRKNLHGKTKYWVPSKFVFFPTGKWSWGIFWPKRHTGTHLEHPEKVFFSDCKRPKDGERVALGHFHERVRPD